MAQVAQHTAIFVQELNRKFPEDTFDSSAGRKYDRVIKCARYGDSVFAFINRETGDLYKAANWNAPAQGVRFPGAELLTTAIDKADTYGAFLYKN